MLKLKVTMNAPHTTAFSVAFVGTDVNVIRIRARFDATFCAVIVSPLWLVQS